MTNMARGEWRQDPRFRMDWCLVINEDDQAHAALESQLIPKLRSGEYTEDEFRELTVDSYDGVRLDFAVPAGVPDGIHTVFHKSGWRNKPERGVSSGVVVKDGQFEPHSTEAAVYEAVCKSYDVPPQEYRHSRFPVIDHIYIESFDWHHDIGQLEVHTGS